MPKKLKKNGVLIVSGFVVAVFFQIQMTSAASPSLNTEERAVDMVTQQIKQKLKRGTYFLLGIDTQLKNSREEIKLLKDNVHELQNKIRESDVQITDLTSQLENLDRLIEVNREKIEAIKIQIARQENRILILKDDIQEREKELRENLASLDHSLTTLYLQTNSFFGETGEGNLLAFLASESNTGDILKQHAYLSFLQRASQDLAVTIMEQQQALGKEREELDQKQKISAALQILLQSEQRTLSSAQASKQRLLTETQGRQAIYETLLELSKKEAEQVTLQIERLKENYSFFQTKLDELRKNPGISELPFPTLENELLDEENSLKGEMPLSWPVSPALGLSALFHDTAYQKALGVAHNAIDIRVIQGSKIKAAQDGVVTKVADNGFAYSYIIVAHPDRILTLYGHLSEILVSEGEIVRQGQTIGLSGGIPGTKGAGWLTTGAHLHFEVFKNWQQVDPLEYLPLEFVPVASLPEKYLERLEGTVEEKVRRMP
jgi:murein DD-endopeptidase MepM/ murein hydrolase activator NlpD